VPGARILLDPGAWLCVDKLGVGEHICEQIPSWDPNLMT
jgi:hypothetical protein